MDISTDPKPLDLSIVVVNWNTKELLDKCLDSVYRTVTRPAFDVWVVDNASTDGSAEMVRCKYPQAHCLENTENVGFSRANNQAMDLSGGETILLLNSDIELTENAVNKTWELLNEHQSIGAMGCVLKGYDGTTQESWGYSLPHGPSLRKENRDLPDGLVDSAWIWAAFMLVRRAVVREVGMFDEEFRMFHEDTDWCWRIIDAGWHIAYCPYINVIHGCRQSVGSLPRSTYYRWLLIGDNLLYRKHHQRWQVIFQIIKRFAHYSLLAGCHWLAYCLTHAEAHAERVEWFKTARSAVAVMWKPVNSN